MNEKLLGIIATAGGGMGTINGITEGLETGWSFDQIGEMSDDLFMLGIGVAFLVGGLKFKF